MTDIPNWTDYFLNLAKNASIRSNCIRAQVGAVIVGQDNHVKALGYNGTPSKVKSCKEMGSCYRVDNCIPSGTQYETCRSIHAEQNAIIQAGEERCNDAKIYVYGHSQICILCKRFIVQSGIKEIFLQKDENSKVIHIFIDQLRYELERGELCQSITQ